MSIDKYVITITELHTNIDRQIILEGNSAIEVHKKALPVVNNLTEEITEIKNSEEVIVYSLKNGFQE